MYNILCTQFKCHSRADLSIRIKNDKTDTRNRSVVSLILFIYLEGSRAVVPNILHCHYNLIPPLKLEFRRYLFYFFVSCTNKINHTKYLYNITVLYNI